MHKCASIIVSASQFLLWSVSLVATAARADDPLVLPPIESSQDLLAGYGATPERLAQFADGRPMQGAENESLLRTLAAVRRFTLGELVQWRKPNVGWDKLSAAPARHRGELMALEGRVTRVRVERPSESDAARFQLERYYRCDVTLAGSGRSVVVDALRIPSAWKLDQAIDERAGCDAVFLKFLETNPQPIQPVFVAKRMAWYPADELGDLHMDVGLFDDVQNRAAISSAERDCFYALLAAVGRTAPGELPNKAAGRFPVEPLFNEPAQQSGKLIGLIGTVIRAIPIHVEDPEIVAAFGLDHYYELELVAPDSQGNPLVCCVREIPPEMQPGERMAVDVRVAGFFFKSWAYRSHPAPDESGTKPATLQARYQLAPLIVGREVLLLPSPDSDNWLLETTSYGLLALVVFGIALATWWYRREDRRFRQRMELHSTVNPPIIGPVDIPD